MEVSAMRRRATTLGLIAAALLGPALPGLAAPGTETIQVGNAAEAWYQPPPTCSSPPGCGPVPAAPAPSIFPPGTLHVGVTAGVENSRTYVRLDPSAFSVGTVPVGGLVTLPIAGPDDGTRAPETAKVRLCLVTGEVVDGVEGDTGAPPPIDCVAAQSPAVFVPATDAAPAALTADLTPFAAAWAAGAPMQGLAVVPAEGVPPTDSWRVVFSQTDRATEGGQPITTSLTVSSDAAASQDVPDGLAAGDSSSTGGSASSDLSFGSGSGSGSGSSSSIPLSADLGFAPAPITSPPLVDTAQPPPPQVDVPVEQPVEQPAAQPVAAPAVFSLGGFAYPAVFLLPLVFAGAVAWAGRALTRDLLPGPGPVVG